MRKRKKHLEFNINQIQQLPSEQLLNLIMQQQQVIEELQQEVERLKLSLQQNSKTTSKPPSTDLLLKPEKPPADKEQTKVPKRKPGGQPGHQGKTRFGFGRVDRHEQLLPQECPKCGSVEFIEAPVAVERKQVAQLVAHPIEVVEYQRQSCKCVHCGHTHTADWPDEIVPGQDLGVGLQSLLVWLGNYGHLSYEKQQELLRELGGIEVGVGTLVATNARMAQAVKGSVDRLREWVKGQPRVHVDESPWPVLGLKEWLWVTTGQNFCVFHPGDTRSRAELIAQLGESFDGVLSTDDYSVYNGYSVKAQQKCLAHLRRHFKKLLKLKRANNQAIGQAFLDLIDEAFAQHQQWRQTHNDSIYHTWAIEFKLRVTLTLKRWIGRAGYEAGKLLKSLRDKAEQWWYFLDHPEVPPDNNLAERNLRLAVTKRKVSGGSRSMKRFAQTADLLSVVQTCRRQGRSVIEFFQAALMTQTSSGQSLSLLPEPIP
ncbi:MAG: IS66 family transposase [Symploca sp. SIO2C1]|nr:IS66 family transposase [Symploca sp. SIO2C1]